MNTTDTVIRHLLDWLESNRASTNEKRSQYIADYLKANVSQSDLFKITITALLKTDDAMSVIERERRFEPLIKIGFKTLRANQTNSAKLRKGGRSEKIRAIKRCLQKEKSAGIKFESFLKFALAGTVEDLECSFIAEENKYDIGTPDFDGFIRVSKLTIKDWYTDCRRIKK